MQRVAYKLCCCPLHPCLALTAAHPLPIALFDVARISPCVSIKKTQDTPWRPAECRTSRMFKRGRRRFLSLFHYNLRMQNANLTIANARQQPSGRSNHTHAQAHHGIRRGRFSYRLKTRPEMVLRSLSSFSGMARLRTWGRYSGRTRSR